MTDTAESGDEQDRERLPVTVLTGFLGSGKTTLLSKLLRHPGMGNTAVVINEFGEVGLDHRLVESSSEDMVMMDSGCLCCTIRGDLIETLRDLIRRRWKGEIAAFERLVIETTGLADPAPILHTLMTDPVVSGRYRLDGVVATVDAVNGAGQLDSNPEAVKQAAVADRIVVTKADIANPDAVAALVARLHVINPGARLIEASYGEVDPGKLLDAGLYDPSTKSMDVENWLREEAYADSHNHLHDHGHDVNRHDDRIGSFCITRDEPIAWDPFVEWMEALISVHGANLLRIKGILCVKEAPGPVAVHGVQHVFHPPSVIGEWADGDDRRSRIVMITRDISKKPVEDMLDAFLK